MPISATLAARLARRGIIRQETAPPTPSDSEEVFAQNYEDASDEKGSTNDQAVELKRAKKLEDPQAIFDSEPNIKTLGFSGCPYKSNPYHDCCLECVVRHTTALANNSDAVESRCSAEYLSKFRTMIDKLGPLPEAWHQEFDSGVGRHYFWSQDVDGQFSSTWLHPSHPKAKFVPPASVVRAQIRIEASQPAKVMAPPKSAVPEEFHREEDRLSSIPPPPATFASAPESATNARVAPQFHGSQPHAHRQTIHLGPEGGAPGIDPMDPSSYSDAPLGTWSRGLAQN